MSLTAPPRHRVAIDIAICTFRRAALADALASLATIARPPEAEIRVIVADNDVTPSARMTVDQAAGQLPFEIRYIHCPASNISLARNACLDHSDADFLAFMDDDEIATGTWLAALLAEAQRSDADVVLGPVRAIYRQSAPGWMRRIEPHSTHPVWVGGEIRTGYTCNTLIRLSSPSIAGRRFNLALGRSGGEDTEFLTLAHEAGASISFAPDAWLEEPVPAERERFAWLAARRYRSGQTHGRLLRRDDALQVRMRRLLLACTKMGFCAAAAAAFGFSTSRRHSYALRGIMHAGVVSGLLGVQEIRQYGLEEARAR